MNRLKKYHWNVCICVGKGARAMSDLGYMLIGWVIGALGALLIHLI